MAEELLKITGLKTYFRRPDGVDIKAVDGVSLTISVGETLCVVGESGCGKSMTALSIMDLIQKPQGRIAAGTIEFEGHTLTDFDEYAMCDVRGKRISMIFQEPMTSLNPVLTIGRQVSEVLLRHTSCGKAQANEKALQMLKAVGIPRAEELMREYPHQLSGGMRQRVMIAMALICEPALLIADEPTTALDVTIQAQVLDLITAMKAKINMAVLFITHDMAVVSRMADRVIVMYAGQVVEETTADELFIKPMHPYTRALLAAIPFVDKPVERLYSIRGTVPDAVAYPDHCRFMDRCDYAREDCGKCDPGLLELTPGHWVRCSRALTGGII